MVASYDQMLVKELADYKLYVVNKLVEQSANPDPKHAFPALKALGEVDGVDAFKRRSEVTVKTKPIDEVEKDLLARLELAACGTRIAALEFTPCDKHVALATEASPADQSYAQFLDGQWRNLDSTRLPAHYTRLVSAKDDAAANQAAQDIKDPLARLIAAGLLLKQSRATPQTLTTAIDTASERGWQRPLLMWLKIEQQRAQNAGDQKSAHSLQRRIELTLGNLAP
jgi:hypothetical protein